MDNERPTTYRRFPTADDLAQLERRVHDLEVALTRTRRAADAHARRADVAEKPQRRAWMYASWPQPRPRRERS
jgi:hypothetical protein